MTYRPVLAKHINASMLRGVFPDILKVGQSRQNTNKYDKELFENYRPVPLSQFLLKFWKKPYMKDIIAFYYHKKL